MIGHDQLVQQLGPNPVRDVQFPWSAVVRLFQDLENRWREDQLVERLVELEPLLECLNQVMVIDIDRVGFLQFAQAENRNRLATANRTPEGEVLLDLGKERTADLLEHRSQGAGRILSIVQLHSQVRLANAGLGNDGIQGHPNINAKAGNIGFPNGLF